MTKLSLILSLMAAMLAPTPECWSGPVRLDFAEPFTARFDRRGDGRFLRIYGCRRTGEKPTIDGKLDEAAWKGLKAISLAGGEPETAVRACFDDSALYVGFECRQREGREPTGIPRGRDEAVWLDDAVEVVVGSTEHEDLWHFFIISIANSVFDQKNRGQARCGRYDPEFEHAVHRGQGRWTVEVAIPAAALGIAAWPAKLGFNVGRDGPGVGPRSWTGVRRDVSASALKFEGVQSGPEKPRQARAFQSNQPVWGRSLGIHVDRSYARPGERWVEIDCSVTPVKQPIEKTAVAVRVSEVAGAKPIHTFSARAERDRARLGVDLRTLGLSMAEVSVEVLEDGERTGASSFILEAKPPAAALGPESRVPINIDVPEGADAAGSLPVTFCVPFPAGSLWELSRARVVDGAGQVLPHQKEVLGRWAPDGSVKWVRFDALVRPKLACSVEVREAPPTPQPGTPLKVSQEDGKITVDTGAARYVLAPGRSPIEEVWMDGRLVATARETRGLYVIDQQGRLAVASATEEAMEVEASGPVAACVRFEGWYATADGVRLARHTTRVECHAGQPDATVTHTLVLTEDTNKVWFREIGWELAVPTAGRAQALFGSFREDFAKSQTVPLGDQAASSAYMFQNTHYFFGHGENHFGVKAVGPDGKETAVLEGQECGDYAGLLGSDTGLGLICRDTARQHPKEFLVSADRIMLKLFSNRAGEELDFRTPTLIKKWDLATWSKNAHSNMYRQYFRKDVEEVLKDYRSDAAGWSKTHHLRVVPLKSESAEASLPRLAKLHRHRVYAHVAPEWVYRSRALGPLYPREPERFPEVEQTVDAFYDWWITADHNWGEYGFVDYFSGPRFNYRYRGDKVWPAMKRYAFMTYLLRPGLWLLYARSGDRRLREYAEGSTLAYIDGRYGHWDTPVCRRGLMRWSGQHHLPFSWGANITLEAGQTSSLNHAVWFYYLTGCRRAGDFIRDHTAGIKERWTPSRVKQSMNPASILWHLAQCYGVTGDPALRDLARATMDILHDPESPVGLSKYSLYASTTNKGFHHLRAFLEAWELIGETRYYQTAKASSTLWFRRDLSTRPDGYLPAMATYGAFLYDEEPSAAVAESLLSKVRGLSACDPATGKLVTTNMQCAAMTSFVTDIGYALHVLAQSGADRGPVASWIAWHNAGRPSAVYVVKPADDEVNLVYRAPGVCKGPLPFSSVNAESFRAQDLFQMTAEVAGTATRPQTGVCGTIRLPKDMPECAYRLSFEGTGNHCLYADRRVSLVLYAPGYWYPEPRQRPPHKYFFRLRQGDDAGQIFFEGRARLYEPSGEPFANGDPQHGWVALPAERAGLWSFEPLDDKLVDSRGFPPFFAVRDPESHFVPDISWQQASQETEAEDFTEDVPFVTGASGREGDKALYLTGRRLFRLAPGPDHPEDDGGVFLPHRQGTVEFFLKPDWTSAELPDGTTKRFIFAPFQKAGGSNYFNADYTVRGRAKTLSLLLNSTFHNSDFYKGETVVRAYREWTFFERGKWAHVAYVWGPRKNTRFYPQNVKRADGVLKAEIYVNGRLGFRGYGCRNSGKNSLMLAPLRFLQIGMSHPKYGNIDAAIDELRVSDSLRYTADFAPPPMDRELPCDADTRALFHFNGNLNGESSATDEPLAGAMK